jgi:hypothetical protein
MQTQKPQKVQLGNRLVRVSQQGNRVIAYNSDGTVSILHR